MLKVILAIVMVAAAIIVGVTVIYRAIHTVQTSHQNLPLYQPATHT
jgi:hypothetical protein